MIFQLIPVVRRVAGGGIGLADSGIGVAGGRIRVAGGGVTSGGVALVQS